MAGTTTKPGYLTAAFWLTILAQLIGFAYMSGAIASGSPVDKIMGLVITMLAAAGYSVNRGIIKAGPPAGKPAWATTEFWITVIGGLVGAIQASGALVAGTVVEKAVGILVMLLGLLGYHAGHALSNGNQKGITIETFGTLAPGAAGAMIQGAGIGTIPPPPPGRHL